MIRTWAQTKTRSSTSVAEPSPNSPDRAFDTGDHPSGHSLMPSAIRDACQSSSVVTIPAIRPRIRSASPRWLPSKRAGRWTLRMANAAITPSSTIVANTSTSSANQPWWPSHGRVASLSTAPIIAITIVGNRTRKPQKIAACIRPGPRRWSSLRCPSTITASLLGALAELAGAVRRLAAFDEVHQQFRTAGEEEAGDGERRGEGDGSDRDVYEPRAFLSSAVIAGTISVRSPITA